MNCQGHTTKGGSTSARVLRQCEYQLKNANLLKYLSNSQPLHHFFHIDRCHWRVFVDCRPVRLTDKSKGAIPYTLKHQQKTTHGRKLLIVILFVVILFVVIFFITEIIEVMDETQLNGCSQQFQLFKVFITLLKLIGASLIEVFTLIKS